MRNRKVTVAARSKCTCAGWWRWALLDRLHGSTGLRANFGSTVMDTIRRQCHRSGQLHYFLPKILAVGEFVGARDEVHAMRRKKFFGTGLRFGRVRWGASVSQSVIYFTVPPRAAHPTSLRRRVSSVPQDRISRASHTNFGQHRSIMDTAQSHSHTKKFRSPLLSIDKY